MQVLGQEAFVLHVRPWRETSVIVELLTRDHGRVGVVARGLTTPKRHVLRAALQPLQWLRLDYLPRGELARLLQAETIDAAPSLTGDRLMAAFYVHELLLRMTPRNDAAQSLFDLYARVRGELPRCQSLAWALRRFERDLLDRLGVGLPWDATADGEPVQPGSRYRLDPELGPILQGGSAASGVGGAALLSLANDTLPDPASLQQLRRVLRKVLESHLGDSPLRKVLESHLGDSPLRSWGLLDELARVRPAG